MKDPELLYLVGGVVAVLLIASLVTRLLIRKSGETPVLVNLRQRVNAWWWMMLIFSSSLALGRGGVFGFQSFQHSYRRGFRRFFAAGAQQQNGKAGDRE